MTAPEALLELGNMRAALCDRAERAMASWAKLCGEVDAAPDRITAGKCAEFAEAHKQTAMRCERRAEALAWALAHLPELERETDHVPA